MAVRTDFTIDYTVSPRIVTIAAPSTTVTVQDLYDTLASDHALPWNSDDPILISASGKDALGGVKQVGVTARLLNTRLAFQERTIPVDTGTATTADSTGDTLIDSAATFQTTGIQKGDVIMNFTDGSSASVLTVDSETQITHTQLSGGVGNNWDVSDSYAIFRIAFCKVTDGNLVAVDAGGTPIEPIFPTFGTEVQIELDVSPALILSGSGVTEQDKDDIRDRILSDSTAFPGANVTAVRPRRNVAFNNFPFPMFDNAGNLLTSLTVSGLIRQDSGALAALANTPAEVGSGLYDIDLTASEMDATIITLILTAAGARPQIITMVTSL